jgi:hypothetical protein
MMLCPCSETACQAKIAASPNLRIAHRLEGRFLLMEGEKEDPYFIFLYCIQPGPAWKVKENHEEMG